MRLRAVEATRYVTPFREGGSLPALVEASDDGLYVLKFRGAGQGPKALVAEVVAGEVARALGLAIPELALVRLDAMLGRAEPDPEIQDLLAASVGLNLGVDFLPGALAFNPAAGIAPRPELAAEIVWFDALTTNVDRTAKNPNLLLWHGRLWLIDHGAALYFHHTAGDAARRGRQPFPAIAEHVLLPFAGPIDAADARLAPLVTPELLHDVAAAVPAEWLEGDDPGMYVGVPARAAAASARVRRRGRAGPWRLARSPTPLPRRAAPRARRADQRRRRRLLQAAALPGGADGARRAPARGAVAGARSRDDPAAPPRGRADRRRRSGGRADRAARRDRPLPLAGLALEHVIQPSAVHSGLCSDPAAELDKLFDSLVLTPAGAD